MSALIGALIAPWTSQQQNEWGFFDLVLDLMPSWVFIVWVTVSSVLGSSQIVFQAPALGGRWDIFNSLAYLLWWRVCLSVGRIGAKCLIIHLPTFLLSQANSKLMDYMLCNQWRQRPHEAESHRYHSLVVQNTLATARAFVIQYSLHACHERYDLVKGTKQII